MDRSRRNVAAWTSTTSTKPMRGPTRRCSGCPWAPAGPRRARAILGHVLGEAVRARLLVAYVHPYGEVSNLLGHKSFVREIVDSIFVDNHAILPDGTASENEDRGAAFTRGRSQRTEPVACAAGNDPADSRARRRTDHRCRVFLAGEPLASQRGGPGTTEEFRARSARARSERQEIKRPRPLPERASGITRKPTTSTGAPVRLPPEPR
jgi:hypothetical protein